MRYVCVHCDHRWEAGAAETKERCPSCMRSTGVQLVADVPEAGRASPRHGKRRLAWALLTLLAAVGGYFVWGRRPTAGDSELVAPLALPALRERLSSQRVAAGELEALLVGDAKVAQFARRALAGGRTPYEKAEGITRAIRARASALAFVPWSLGEPRPSVVRMPAETLAALQPDKARAELYPLEVAALAVSALRSVEVPAMLAELIQVEGERAPLDPSGYLGYFAVAVYAGEAGLGAPRLFDPYGGRALSAGAKHAVLRDDQAVGAALSLRALHEASYLADPQRALESSSHALALAGTLPSVRTVRGMVVLLERQLEQGLQEFAAARQLRGDAARLHNLATVELMTGDLERASRDLDAALASAPDFASARVTLATLAAMRGELERARAELAEAQRLAPDLSNVQWALAELSLRSGEREQALALARRARETHPSFDARLRMGILLREVGHYDELRKEAEGLLAMAPPSRASELRELIKRALGPAALDRAAPRAEDLALSPDRASPALQLEPSSKLLEDDAPGPKLPALRGPDEPASGPSRLRLREQGDLQLQLGR